MSASLINESTRIKVSSVLNRDVTTFGKQNLTDGDDETCWNSEQGLPQYILLDFRRPVFVRQIQLMFQGGFVGKKCQLLGGAQGSQYEPITTFYPDDSGVQMLSKVIPFLDLTAYVFPISSLAGTERLQIVFEESTDFYGRITVYKLDVIGEEA
ncbi:galactose-binding domain-like protein [Endogone sp. FLAS-F59071]|nr:galactose-binding domain-like protein [Endogone sp. FLAS-F59071]|eukprot:RUS15971.1 galactose-binding domain-like protein [Endogone sp. FLAS-F59071]